MVFVLAFLAEYSLFILNPVLQYLTFFPRGVSVMVRACNLLFLSAIALEDHLKHI